MARMRVGIRALIRIAVAELAGISLSVVAVSAAVSPGVLGCGGNPEEHVPFVSADLLTVDFYNGVRDSAIQSVAEQHSLLILFKHYWQQNPRYRMEIDRRIVPQGVTASAVAESLLIAQPGVVMSAHAVVVGRAVSE